MKAWMLMVAVAAAVPQWAAAVETKRVVFETYEDWRKGEADGAAILEEGAVTAGGRFAAVTNLASAGVQTVWCAVPDGKGGALLGTGPGGLVLRADAAGRVSQVAKLPGSHVYAVAAGPDGAAYAAASPDGKVYRIPAGREPEVYFEPGEKHVWALQWIGQDLYVATGIRGRLFKVAAKGRGAVVYDGEESNLRCLAGDREGRLLIGTEGRGLLLRLEEAGRAFALFDTGRGEVRQIATDAEGHVAFIAGGKAGSAPKRAESRAVPSDAPGTGEAKKEGAAKEGAASETPSPKVEIATAAAPGGGDLWLLVEPGFARRLWSGSELPQSLVRHEGAWLVGTSGEGRIYGVNDLGEERLLGRIESKDATALVGLGGVLWASGSNEAAWLRLAAAGDAGWYRSEAIDAGGFSAWGAVRVEGEGVVARTRSGNTREPDGTWHPWAALEGGKAASPAGRYMQFELRFQGDGRARRAEVFYTPRNLPPEIGRIIALPSGEGYEPAPRAMSPPPVRSVSQVATAKREAPGDGGEEARFLRVDRRSYRTLVWSAKDPNGDKIEYRVAWRLRGAAEFTPIGEPVETALFSLDTAGWRDGRYEFRIMASDRPSNPSAPLSAERISELVVIDNRPPQIGDARIEGTNAVFRVEDTTSVLTSVEVSADGAEFGPAMPADGVLDSPAEEFRVPVPAGRLFIRARDEAQNEAGTTVGN